MSSIVIKGNTSGQVEIAAPDIAGSTTLTLPTGTANLLTADGDGSQLTNLPQPASLSTASGSAPSYSARAWVNFRGTSTVTIRASGNVSSVTDNGTGNYTVNFTTAMADANYAAPFSSGDDTISDMIAGVGNYTSTSVRVTTRNGANSNIDTTYISVAIFR